MIPLTSRILLVLAFFSFAFLIISLIILQLIHDLTLDLPLIFLILPVFLVLVFLPLQFNRLCRHNRLGHFVRIRPFSEEKYNFVWYFQTLVRYQQLTKQEIELVPCVVIDQKLQLLIHSNLVRNLGLFQSHFLLLVVFHLLFEVGEIRFVRFLVGKFDNQHHVGSKVKQRVNLFVFLGEGELAHQKDLLNLRLVLRISNV